MEIKYLNFIRDLTHVNDETIDFTGTLKNLFDSECYKHGDCFKNKIIKDEIKVIIDGKFAENINGLHTELTENSHVCITCSSHWHK